MLESNWNLLGQWGTRTLIVKGFFTVAITSRGVRQCFGEENITLHLLPAPGARVSRDCSKKIKDIVPPWNKPQQNDVTASFEVCMNYTVGAYPGFCSMKRLGVFLLPLDGTLVHRRSLSRNLLGFPRQLAGTHLYSWVERDTVRVKCLAQEHNTVSPTRAQARTPRSGNEVNEYTNHEATMPQLK